MATKLYVLNDAGSHVVTSEEFQEVSDLALGPEPVPYLVMATVDCDRDELRSEGGEQTWCQVRLDVFSGLGALLGSDHQEFRLSTVLDGLISRNSEHSLYASDDQHRVGAVIDALAFSSVDRTPSSRHASLMVTATVPAEGDAGRDTSFPFTVGETETSGTTLLVPPPRAVLSACRLTSLNPDSRLALSNVRIVAFQADEVVAKHV